MKEWLKELWLGFVQTVILSIAGMIGHKIGVWLFGDDKEDDDDDEEGDDSNGGNDDHGPQ